MGNLQKAGIKVNGRKPWDIQVHNEDVFRRFLIGGSLGVGESYMDGGWDAARLDEFFTRVFETNAHRLVVGRSILAHVAKAVLMDLCSCKRAFEVGRSHYDLGNGFYEKMLDESMTYSCGYWRSGVETLHQAQMAKYDLICRKLGLQLGMRILEIGCGWGGFARYAAEECGVSVIGLTISKEQAHFAQTKCANLPVSVLLQDYRSSSLRHLYGTFDRVVSIGMFEHVGYKHYSTYMKIVRRFLNPDGLFLLHTIGNNVSQLTTDRWIDKYIFPNSMLPSMRQIAAATEGLFVTEDWHSFGPDYDRTLMEWHRNFCRNWSEITKLGAQFDEKFRRMWEFYLLSCAGLFRARQAQLWQFVLSPNGVAGSYESVR